MNSELFYFVCFQTEEVVPWLPAVGTVILLLFLAFSFFFSVITNLRVFM